MAEVRDQELVDRFETLYRRYYADEISELARGYPRERKSLVLDWQDLFRFDPDFADEFVRYPDRFSAAAEEALRLYDLPVDVSLGQAHVRVENLGEVTEIREIRAEHLNTLVSVRGIVRKATNVRPKIEQATFVCQRCGAETVVPQSEAGFQEPYQCESCERQGPFRLDGETSEFVDAQKLRIQESPEGLGGGETPQSVDMNVEDDLTGAVTPGDHVVATGILRLDQGKESTDSPIFDVYLEGISLEVEDEEFEEMDITPEDKREIIELSEAEDLYDQIVDSIAPAIYGYEQAKLAMALQLFSGVTKHLPDGSRIRGDLHMLLIGDPGTGKCVAGDTHVTLADGTRQPIRDLVESNLTDPKPVDDGVFDDVDIPLPTMYDDGTLGTGRATKVWKREAPETMYRVELADGTELVVTPSHPLFVQQHGRPAAVNAAELDVGTFVATGSEIETTHDDHVPQTYRRSRSNNAVRLQLPDTWTPALARLIGYVVAEGYVESRDDNTGFVSITNNDEEILDDVRTTLTDLGLSYFERGGDENPNEVICSAGELVSFIETIEPAMVRGSADQRIPKPILRASPQITKAFLSAYIDAEGHVSVDEREITVASMSRALLFDVKVALLEHGIRSAIHPRRNGSYRLRISGNAFGRYVDTIDLVTDRKRLAASAVGTSAGNTNVDTVPNVGPEIERIRRTLGLTQFDCGIPRSTYQHYERGDRNPSVASLDKVLDAFETRVGELRDIRNDLEGGDWGAVERVRTELGLSQAFLAEQIDVEQTTISLYERGAVVPDGGRVADAKGVLLETLSEAIAIQRDIDVLRTLTQGDIGWTRIVEIEPVPPEEDWVYDLEVAETHNYLTEHVVSHNSQLLQYIRHIAPRSVYTSGKGSSSAGLTAAAVRDDFGDGQQWTLEAGALVLADKGIAAVDELDKMRCVTGDTLVSLGDGQVKQIGDIARVAASDGTIEELERGRTIRDVDDLSVRTMADDGTIVERPVTAIHEYEAPDVLQEVTLESGEKLTATADHPFFVFKDGERVERSAEDLSQGDWVYVPEAELPKSGDGGVVTEPGSAASAYDTARDGSEALASVVGYLSGDGNVYFDRSEGTYGIRFTNKEEELLEHFEMVADVAFDVAPVRHPSEQRDDGVETVRVIGKSVAEEVLEAGMNLRTYDEKAFPNGVTKGSRAEKAAFVRALADSEGTVDTSTGNVKLFSASRELLTGAKELLREFGITSQLQVRPRGDKRDLYILAVTSAASLRNFRRHIGFTLSRKRSALNTVVDSADGSRTILDVIPDLGPRLAETRSKLRLHQSECGDSAYGDFERGTANTSIHRAKSILTAFVDRKAEAKSDMSALDHSVSWERLSELRRRYHVSQAELAAELEFSQQKLSEQWSDSDDLRSAVITRLRAIIGGVATTDLGWFKSLVHGDVKWRRVAAVDTTSAATRSDDRIEIICHELADEFGWSRDAIESTARAVLNRRPKIESLNDVASALETYNISQRALAERIGVNQSTISRWLTGTVDATATSILVSETRRLVNSKRQSLDTSLREIDERRVSKVYDLTVEGTHNFVANGMIVHNSEDRSAMHEALEQQSISISKAGINATLKSRCSLLGAANPKYGRFDQYESIGEQIDLEPALISRFDLIFTITDQPDAERDAELASHILQTNYAGELNTHRENVTTSNVTIEEVDGATEKVAPAIDADFLRKYVAYSRRNTFPTMTNEAKQAIETFYVDLRSRGQEEDAPVPVTARKLEALVRLAEASARVRLSDTVEKEDAERVIDIVRTSLKAVGVDPETDQFDADVIETGTSKSQRDRIKNIKHLIEEIETEFDEGAPVEEVLARAEEVGMERGKAEHEIEKLKQRGEVYEPSTDHLRTT